jgi:ribosomal protein L28
MASSRQENQVKGDGPKYDCNRAESDEDTRRKKMGNLVSQTRLWEKKMYE